MKKILIMLAVITGLLSCKTQTLNTAETSNKIEGDTVKISNNDLQYEVIIIDGAFVNWLNTRAFPRGYHSEIFLENRTRSYVTEWNIRAMQSNRYDKNLYEMQINYDSSIKYGYEVNYLIYNYMIYFQNTYNQRLYGLVPPR